MEIVITARNKEIKTINEFDLENELAKILPIKASEVDLVKEKLDRGDLLGFNDIHFKKKG